MMARPGWTTKPCEGCGGKSQVGRPTGEVCHTCKTAIADGKRYLEMTRQLEGRELAQMNTPRHISHLDRNTKQKFSDGMTQLAFLVSTEVRWPDVPEDSDPPLIFPMDNSGSIHSGIDGVRSFPPMARRLFHEIYEAAVAISEEAYEEGKRHGSNLIEGLATGRFSIDEFNEHSRTNGDQRLKTELFIRRERVASKGEHQWAVVLYHDYACNEPFHRFEANDQHKPSRKRDCVQIGSSVWPVKWIQDLDGRAVEKESAKYRRRRR